MLLAPAIALGAVAGVACGDDDPCAVQFAHGDFDENMCEAIDLVADCLEDRRVEVGSSSDAELEFEIGWCVTSLKLCSVREEDVDTAAFRELTLQSNDCAG